MYAHLDQYDQALAHCQRALGLHRESGALGGVADTLDSLGYVYLHLADFTQAKAHYKLAVEAYREIGSLFGVGNSLAGLAEARLGTGEPEAARTSLQEAKAILRSMSSYEIIDLKLRLTKLEKQLIESANHSEQSH
jgi:tetratricopeptide (TPR) repeat protein